MGKDTGGYKGRYGRIREMTGKYGKIREVKGE